MYSSSYQQTYMDCFINGPQNEDLAWFYSLGRIRVSTAVQLVFNPFSQLVPQLELYSQLQLSIWSDPIAFSVPKLT